MTARSSRWNRLCLSAALIAAVLTPLPACSQARAEAQAQESLMPFAMLRSLQFVQDSVARGDHSASEMQRFMLQMIDRRLREAPPAIFKDERNVDAALVYAMSGGNPATLELLVARDVDGSFDNRVTDVLRKYLNGKGTMVASSIAAMVPEYRGKPIGAYLALIGGNVTIPTDPLAALAFYDIARIDAPGTIVEEAALRRSLAIAAEDGDARRGLGYANRYARRYLHSPYASQFADLLVALAVKRFGDITQAEITETLDLMDGPRQREVYLRMARLAAISGKDALARLASEKATALAGETTPDGVDPQAALYRGLSDIGTPDIVSAIEAIDALPADRLSDEDLALREAARALAREIVRRPQADAGTDVSQGREDARNQTGSGGKGGVWRATAPVLEPESEDYRRIVTTGRGKLDEIDDLLKKEGTSR